MNTRRRIKFALVEGWDLRLFLSIDRVMAISFANSPDMIINFSSSALFLLKFLSINQKTWKNLSKKSKLHACLFCLLLDILHVTRIKTLCYLYVCVYVYGYMNRNVAILLVCVDLRSTLVVRLF